MDQQSKPDSLVDLPEVACVLSAMVVATVLTVSEEEQKAAKMQEIVRPLDLDMAQKSEGVVPRTHWPSLILTGEDELIYREKSQIDAETKILASPLEANRDK